VPGQARVGDQAAVFLVHRLSQLAARQAHWIRPLESWQPSGTSLRREFRSLIHHLLARYPAPGYLDAAFDQPAGPSAFRQVSWFIRLARGASVDSLSLPLPLTRAMQHHLRTAPDDLSPMGALRFAEVRGLGGGIPLAREIADSILNQQFEHVAFWRSTLLILIAHEKSLRRGEVCELIDSIYDLLFAAPQIPTENGIESRTPACPDLAMKGRTLDSLRRLVNDWRPHYGDDRPVQRTWPQSQPRPLLFPASTTPDGATWRIVELLNATALRVEGRALRHCVAMYDWDCDRRLCAIWSLRRHEHGVDRPVATIELNLADQTIEQLKAYKNRRPSPVARTLVDRWAKESNIVPPP